MNWYKYTFSTLIWVVAFMGLQAQLQTGDIAFVGFDSDNQDPNMDGDKQEGMAFITLTSIPANTTIYFTDHEWKDGQFDVIDKEEAFWEWTNEEETPVGTVIIITINNPGTLGEMTPNPEVNIGMAEWSVRNGFISGIKNGNPEGDDDKGEIIYAYLGDQDSDEPYMNPTVFLTAIANITFDDAEGNDNGFLPDQLKVEGDDGNLLYAISFEGLNGSLGVDLATLNNNFECNGTIEECRALINNPLNWYQQPYASGDQSLDGAVPDYPRDVPTSIAGSVLPVELLYFTASYRDKFVQLEWVTVTELNNSHFEIERSRDGIHFETIGQVEGFGTTEQIQTYQFEDRQLFQGRYYYRLRQVDFDGAFEYFHLVEVIVEGTTEIGVLAAYPNPVTDTYHMELSLPSSEYTQISLYDLQGNRVWQAKVKDSRAGYNALHIDVGFLQSGMYIYRLESGTRVIQGKFLKK